MSQQFSSSQISKSSNYTANKFSTINPALMVRKTAVNSEAEGGELALESYINSLQLHTFFQLSEEDQDECLEKIDSLELFQVIQEINRELAMVKLENHFLKDFLQNNDPKLLIGLQQRRATAQSQQLNVRKISKDTNAMSMDGSSVGFRTRGSYSRSLMTTMSINTVGSQKKAAYDYKLNFRAKADMAEKNANEVEKRIHEIESKASREIKSLRGHMEEMRFMCEETQETAKNFELHFLRDERDIAFLNTATEKQLDRKIRKFVNNWIKNARALLATMRLKITALQEHCQQLRNELLTKTDLSGILTAIDFEKLKIKRTELLNSLEEKNVHMAGLKGVTGRASLSMAEEKQIMMNIEKESKELNNKTSDVVKAIAKLENEANIAETENEKDLSTLKNLKTQLERFEAPSVNQYIAKKDEVLALEKEEKMLRRKISILNMKMDNTQKKFKRKPGSYIIVNERE